MGRREYRIKFRWTDDPGNPGQRGRWQYLTFQTRKAFGLRAQVLRRDDRREVVTMKRDVSDWRPTDAE